MRVHLEHPRVRFKAVFPSDCSCSDTNCNCGDLFAMAASKSNRGQDAAADADNAAPPSKRVKSETNGNGARSGTNSGTASADASANASAATSPPPPDDEELLATARMLDGQDQRPQEENDSSKAAAAADDDAQRRQRRQQEEEEEDDHVHKQRAAKLKFLLQRSGVYSQIMADKMEKEKRARIAAAEKAAGGADAQQQQNGSKDEGAGGAGDVKTEHKPDPEPEPTSTRTSGRSTRGGGDNKSTTNGDASATRPKRATAGKRKKEEDWEVSNYISEGDLKKKGSKSATASASASASPGPRPAHSRQPALVTGAELRPYQLDGFEWLVSLYENGLNGILADEMGLGKTLQTIAFLAHLRGKGVWGPFIIVAPLSTIANWVNEFERFTPGIPAMMYHASTKHERAQLRRKIRYPTSPDEKRAFPVVITSFEIAMMDRQHLSHLKWKYIVVDEGHRLKNMNCRLIQELKRFNSAQRLILTGTPLHNNLKELWSLLNFILPDIFDDLETFEKWSVHACAESEYADLYSLRTLTK